MDIGPLGTKNPKKDGIATENKCEKFSGRLKLDMGALKKKLYGRIKKRSFGLNPSARKPVIRRRRDIRIRKAPGTQVKPKLVIRNMGRQFKLPDRKSPSFNLNKMRL